MATNIEASEMKTLLTVVVLIILFSFGCDSDRKENAVKRKPDVKSFWTTKDIFGKQKNLEKKKAVFNDRVQQIKQRLRSRHNAFLFPGNKCNGVQVFSYNLQDYLVSENNRPVLFTGILDDISQNAGNFFIHFNCKLSHDSLDERKVLFHLKCSYDDIKPIINNPPKFSPAFDPELLAWLADPELLASLAFPESEGLLYCVVSTIREVKKTINYKMSCQNSDYDPGVPKLVISAIDTFDAYGVLMQMEKY